MLQLCKQAVFRYEKRHFTQIKRLRKSVRVRGNKYPKIREKEKDSERKRNRDNVETERG